MIPFHLDIGKHLPISGNKALFLASQIGLKSPILSRRFVIVKASQTTKALPICRTPPWSNW